MIKKAESAMPVTVETIDKRLNSLRKDVTDQLDKKLSLLKEELLEVFTSYRDEILTVIDRQMGILEQIREDQLFIKHDVKDHDSRIIKLEKTVFKHA